MSDTPTVHAAMGRVLAALPAIGKTSWNEQQKFHFRGVDAVLNALNPLLAEHGVLIIPHKVIDRVASTRTTRSGGVMYEVNLHVQFRIYGPSGDYIEAEGWGEGTDSGDKATSKAHTAAQKSTLIQAFSVSTEEQTNNEPDRHSPEETVHVIDCPEACGHTAPKAAMRGHLLDAHHWRKTDDGRVIRPTTPGVGSTGPHPDNGAHDAPPGVGTPAASPAAGPGTGEGEAAHGAPDAAPSPGPNEPSKAQLGKIAILLANLGVPDTDRHRYVSSLIGLAEPVTSMKALTKRQASAAIEALSAEEAGVAG